MKRFLRRLFWAALGVTLIPLLLVLFIICLPLIIAIAAINRIRSLQFCAGVRLRWYPEKKYLLFVYSNSPNWKEYIETTLLPKIAPLSVVLNWSEKAQWELTRKPLAVRIFEHWAVMSVDRWRGKLRWGPKREFGGVAGGDEYNPIAIVFIPWWKPTVIRFWEAFKDYKHGRDRRLRQAESQLLTLLARAKP